MAVGIVLLRLVQLRTLLISHSVLSLLTKARALLIRGLLLWEDLGTRSISRRGGSSLLWLLLLS